MALQPAPQLKLVDVQAAHVGYVKLQVVELVPPLAPSQRQVRVVLQAVRPLSLPTPRYPPHNPVPAYCCRHR